MLTQFQIIEPQAAILAACPRPRALAFAAVSAAEWSHSAPIVASARRLGSVEAVRPSGLAEAVRPVSGYGVARVLTDAVRVELGGGNGSAGAGMTDSKQRDPQDPQHLTARRGPVTWRPPH